MRRDSNVDTFTVTVTRVHFLALLPLSFDPRRNQFSSSDRVGQRYRSIESFEFDRAIVFVGGGNRIHTPRRTRRTPVRGACVSLDSGGAGPLNLLMRGSQIEANRLCGESRTLPDAQEPLPPRRSAGRYRCRPASSWSDRSEQSRPRRRSGP
jgi:hypothetical protein